MSSTYADLVFNSFAQAVVASLASRPHQWISWELLQCDETVLSYLPTTRLNPVLNLIELRIVKSSLPSQILKFRSPSNASPSRFITEIMNEKAVPLSTEFKPLLGTLRENIEVQVSWENDIFKLKLKKLDDPLSPEGLLDSGDLALKMAQPKNSILRVVDIRYCNNYGNLSHLIVAKQ